LIFLLTVGARVILIPANTPINTALHCTPSLSFPYLSPTLSPFPSFLPISPSTSPHSHPSSSPSLSLFLPLFLSTSLPFLCNSFPLLPPITLGGSAWRHDQSDRIRHGQTTDRRSCHQEAGALPIPLPLLCPRLTITVPSTRFSLPVPALILVMVLV
jgi:hypothetical protein